MDIRRHLMGLFGVAFLLGGLGLLLVEGSGGQMSGIGIKVGLVLFAIWLAFPQVVTITKRFPPWLIATVAVGGLIIAARPRTIILIAPLLAGIALLQFIGWLFKPLPTKPRRQAKRASKNDP